MYLPDSGPVPSRPALKTITSAGNARFRTLLGLAQSARERKISGLSLLDGVHLVASYVAHVGPPRELALSREGLGRPEVQQLLRQLDASTATVYGDALFRQLSSTASPTGIIAVVPTPRHEQPERLEGPCVWLEDIQDPGNVGSILRTAAAAGIPTVCLSRGSVHAWSPRVLRAGMGAHFSLRIIEGADLDALAANYQGRIIATRADGAQAVFKADLTGPVALVFGNEGAGLSPGWAARAHVVVSVPMPGRIESLNVAAAAAVCLFERVRQTAAQ